MVATMSRPRVENQARWQGALRRAIDNGLRVLVVADTGERMVTSASKPDTLHRSDGRDCTCEAALSGDSVCLHRAAVRLSLGWLRAEVEAPAPQPEACMWCFGTGGVPNDYHQRYDVCDMCDGSGVRKDREPTGNALAVWAGATTRPAAAA